MTRGRALLLAIVALVGTHASPADAQLRAQLGAGSGIGGSSTSGWQRESRLTPSALLYRPIGYLSVDASILERGGLFAIERSAVEAAIARQIAGPFQVSLQSTLTTDAPLRGRDPIATARAAVSARFGAQGVWAGRVQDNAFVPGYMVGAWRGIAGAVFSISAGRRSGVERGFRYEDRMVSGWDSVWTDSIGWVRYQVNRPHRDTIATRRHRAADELEARLHWAHGRWSVTALMHGRSREDSIPARMTGNLLATARVSSRVSLVTHVGSTPPAYGSRAAPRRFAMFGVSLSPGAASRPPLPVEIRPPATAFEIRPGADGLHVLVFRVPNARTVEVSGDFTDWTPVSLVETSANRWEVTLRIRPGSHRLNVRINGDRWTAPPGLPAVEDEFNGKVGLVVVR